MDSGIGQFIPLILIFVIFYFFLIRPQQKKVKEHKAMVENLKRGDKVVTSGGIVGTVERIIDNDKVEVEIAEKDGIVHLRLFTPQQKQPVEIDWIEISWQGDDETKSQRWDF